MIRKVLTSLRIVLLMMLLGCLAFSATAQGQSPTNPQQKPGSTNINNNTNKNTGVRGRSSRFNLNDSQSNTSQYGQDQSSGGMGNSSTSRLRDRKKGDTLSADKDAKPGDAADKKAGEQQDKDKEKSKDKKDGKSDTPPGPRGSRAVVRGGGGDSGTGGGTGTLPAAGQTGSTLPGAGGTQSGARFTRGTGATASVQGQQTVFEPILQRELQYGEVPDEGEPIIFLNGPMTVGEFLETIHMATSWNMLVTEPAMNVQLQFWIVNKKPKEALEILKFHDIFFDFDANTKFLRVMTKEEYLLKQYGTSKPHEFQVKFADVTYIESILTSLLSSTGRLVTDPRTGRIYVWDTEDNLKQMVTTVEELDVPLEKGDFTIKNADLADIESVMSSMLSPNGSLVSDNRTGQIFVWDSPTVLEQMKSTVERLDVPVDSRTFGVQFVNAEDLIDSLEAILSERGLIQVDPRSNSLVVTDLPARLDRIAEVVKTLDVQLETRTWVIKYADIDFVADEVEDLIPDDMGSIIVNEDVHQITITGLPARLDQINDLITVWDVKRQQVLIEAFIVEVGNEAERQFGINWSYYDSSGNAPIAIHSGSGFKEVATAAGSGEVMSVGQLPYAVPAVGALQVDSTGNITRPILTNLNGKQVIDHLAGNNLGLTLKYLDRQNKATILSSPRVLVQDGEEAVFENATRVPYMSTSSNSYPYQTPTSGSSYYPYSYYGGGMNRVEFIDVGTILSVLPRITEEANILLDISAEDSSYKDKSIKSNDQTSTVPEKTVRRAETQLRIKTGETVVLGGLRRSRSSNNLTKTPVLGDVPILGRLFRNPDKASSNNNLLIFITTTIVNEMTDPEAETLNKVEQTITEDVRHNSKDFWGRMKDRSGNQNELSVSVGQSGTIYSQNKRLNMESLRTVFSEVKNPKEVTVLLRKHPYAPAKVVSGIMEMAMEAGLKVVEDDTAVPLVPADPDPAPVQE